MILFKYQESEIFGRAELHMEGKSTLLQWARLAMQSLFLNYFLNSLAARSILTKLLNIKQPPVDNKQLDKKDAIKHIVDTQGEHRSPSPASAK